MNILIKDSLQAPVKAILNPPPPVRLLRVHTPKQRHYLRLVEQFPKPPRNYGGMVSKPDRGEFRQTTRDSCKRSQGADCGSCNCQLSQYKREIFWRASQPIVTGKYFFYMIHVLCPIGFCVIFLSIRR